MPEFTGSSRSKIVVICVIVTILFYAYYINGVDKNPPGFYLDESVISYQAFSIAQTGRSEFGAIMPLYFGVFPKPDGAFDGYANPVYIYTLAALNLVFPPSVGLSRTLSATVVFLACVLLGWMSFRMSESHVVGMVTAATALFTPWLFELSRLVFEVAIHPLAIMIFLTALFKAHYAKEWSLLNCLAIGIGLALVTYSYSTGRLLGPVFALGLFLFNVNKQRLPALIKTFAFYALFLVPMLVFIVRNPGALTQRFESLSVFRGEMGLYEKLVTFLGAYITDIGFNNLLFSGDPLQRNHVPVMGMFFAASLLLGIIGIGISIFRSLKDPWYRYLLFGLVVSVVPGALTLDRSHMLRLSAFPVFFLLLTAPGLAWIFNLTKATLGENKTEPRSDPQEVKSPPSKLIRVPRQYGLAFFAFILISICVQAIIFQTKFIEKAPGRGHLFDVTYPSVMAAAMETDSRPIFLEDGYWGPAYIHAYFYSAAQGIAPSTFVHLPRGERPPIGSVVLSSEEKCVDCELLTKQQHFMLYRVK